MLEEVGIGSVQCTFCTSDVMGVHSAEGKGFFPAIH
jgi:hypothetical protein